jgi:hypothetical protein
MRIQAGEASPALRPNPAKTGAGKLLKQEQLHPALAL